MRISNAIGSDRSDRAIIENEWRRALKIHGACRWARVRPTAVARLRSRTEAPAAVDGVAGRLRSGGGRPASSTSILNELIHISIALSHIHTHTYRILIAYRVYIYTLYTYFYALIHSLIRSHIHTHTHDSGSYYC